MEELIQSDPRWEAVLDLLPRPGGQRVAGHAANHDRRPRSLEHVGLFGPPRRFDRPGPVDDAYPPRGPEQELVAKG